MLARISHGRPTERPPLMIVHGLFGSARNWGVIARRLSDRREVIGVDLRNHGASPWFDTHGYPDLAADLAAEIGGGGPVDMLGHSMGGKAAMVLALTRPELVRRLVVADIAPVAYGHTQMPLIDAMQAIGADFPTRSAADTALAAHVDDPGVRAFLLQSFDPAERRWRLNLDVLRREMPRIVGFPATDASFPGPALFLSGANSPYVRPEHHDTILRLFPAARFETIAGTGHWLHAEKPREVEAAVRAFLDG